MPAGITLVDRGLHLGRVHHPVIVGQHHAVDPSQLRRAVQAAFHVAVRAEAEVPDLAALLGRLGPSLDLGLVDPADVVDAVQEIEVDVVGLQPLERLREKARHVAPCCARPRPW
jgi:hypothetical protein